MLLGCLWLAGISGLHLTCNRTETDEKVISMGYMPVISNLSAPILDHLTKKSDDIRFQAIKFASFAEMVESFRNDHIQAAFLIAPLSIVLKQQGEDIRVVYIGNRHESTLVARKDLNVHGIEDLAGKTVAVPMKYSGHNIALLQLIERKKLEGSITVVEMNPPDMAASLAGGSLDAYFVGEPFAAQTLKSMDADLVHHVEEIWENFICNLLIVKNSFIENNPEKVELMVTSAVRSGFWAQKNPKEAAVLASTYWNQPLELVEFALSTPKNRIVYDQYIPKQAEMEVIADLMVHHGLLKNRHIDELVNDHFARSADVSDVTSIGSILFRDGGHLAKK